MIEQSHVFNNLFFIKKTTFYIPSINFFNQYFKRFIEFLFKFVNDFNDCPRLIVYSFLISSVNQMEKKV